MTIWKRIAPLLAAGLLLASGAQAEEQFDGKVVEGEMITVTAPYGGTIKSISLRAGEQINVGDAVATMETTRVLATEDGTIRGIFADEGDSLTQTVMYLQPVSKYTVSCTIDKAYDSIDTKYVSIGETVYLKCASDGSHKAVGRITAVDGTGYTVQTTGGELYLEETVYVYRDADYSAKLKIGSGTVARTDAIAVTGTGSLLKLHVSDGDEVERGQLLFETVEGTLDGLGVYTDDVQSDASGVIAEVKAQAGQKVSKGDTLLTLYSRDSYRIEFSVTEDLLGTIAEGDSVRVTFNWDEDSGKVYDATVTEISYVSEAQTGTTSSASYKGYLAFEADETIRLGMSVTITTIK